MPIELPRRRPPSEHIVGRDAVRLVSPFEGLSLQAYPDPASARAKTGVGSGEPWTIGYGRAHGVKEGDICTLFQADEWLMEDLGAAAAIIKAQIMVPLTPGEFTALVSLVFNLGYIPKSMKAALNGGTSDKGEVFQPGSYGSALKQFPRNCRAAGIPMRGLLRRRLAEACVFSDLPWEAACSINLVRLKCDAKGNIDPIETTSLEDTLERARQDLPMARPPIDVTKAWPQPAPIEAPSAVNLDSPTPAPIGREIPVQLPLPEIEQDELLLEQAAASVASPDTNEAASEPPPSSPAPGRVSPVSKSDQQPSNSVGPISKPTTETEAAAPLSRSAGPVSGPAPSPLGPAAGVKPAPAEPPLVIAGQDGAKPVHPQTRMPDGIGYGIDPSAGAKPLESTERFVGAAMMWVANGLRVGMANGLKLSGPLGFIAVLFLDMMKQPVTAALICTTIVAIVLGVGWFFGFVLDKAGLKKKKKGEAGASQLMY